MEAIKPCREYLESYLEACIECVGHIHEDYIMHKPEKFDEWKDTIFETYDNHEKGINLPEGFIPNATRWIVDNGRYIGTINIRLELTPQLQNYGGHLGVIIRFSERGKGYGRFAQKALLTEAKKFGIEKALVTVLESNTKSINMCETSPYCEMDTIETMIDGKMQKVRRFWFDLNTLIQN